ncbi:MAG: malto-oligosyltrehalose synthase [Mycobacteriaceae bacterium]|nr:malto-oligosyltrehalose synthase [Mycobacteriaceae bacterium]
MAIPVLSTYRLQLRSPASGHSFTFADAENLLDYLDELGVSHLYLSPIMTAVHGSTHGYDVTDPTTVSAELGGSEGLARLSVAARARGMGLIVDIVPNHVGIAAPKQNRWWWDVLKHGQASPYASFFDIDWELDAGRIVLPLLDSPDDIAGLTVDADLLRLGALQLPIAPGTGDGTGAQIHDRQHYRLVSWRSGQCGYRRFLTISSLAGLRQEDRTVFQASHAEVARWFAEELVDGVRVDHPDGLSNPTQYLSWLRELLGPAAWIVIEKILAAGEPLDPALPVAGTTGYDVLREVSGLFVDPTGAGPLTALVESVGCDHQATPTLVRELKTAAATNTLASELGRLRRSIVAAVGADHPLLDQAVAALLGNIDGYQCDSPELAATVPHVLAQKHLFAAELDYPLRLIAAALAAGGQPAIRLQQLRGAVSAKAVEDCLFYRDARLVSLNEVGGDPQRFGIDVTEFHHHCAARVTQWPQTMTTLTTHDTKRGEDVRARITVLSQVPTLWAQFVRHAEQLAPCPDAATGLFLWQNIFGVWPVNGELSGELRERLHAYTEKAVREAARHTRWDNPDADFECAVHGWLNTVLDGPAAQALTVLVGRLDAHAQSDALGQKLLALTVPGIPDIYQGSELWEDSLVDPDNRRPVAYHFRREALKTMQHKKIRVTAAALRLRRARPNTFLQGGYCPLVANGPAADHVVAFQRGTDVIVAVSRWTVRLADTGWGDTTLPLPGGPWIDTLTGRPTSGETPARQLFTQLPVALLERVNG